MCDFRIIDKIILEDRTRVDTKPIHKPLSLLSEDYVPEEGVGLYHFVATGSCYIYWNGEEWLEEFTEYNYKAWKNGYRFRPGWAPVKWSYDESNFYDMGSGKGFHYDDELIMFPIRDEEKERRESEEWIKSMDEEK